MNEMTNGRIEFTREMRKNYKILFPNMCEIHFRILRNVFLNAGYDIELLTDSGQQVVDEGLKYVHNDTCYPALLTIGQMITALKSGRYDVDHVALMMTQTGGGCRASNYIHLLRKALKNAGFGQVPVISVNMSGLEKNSGFQITLPLLRRGMGALIYGDLLMMLKNQTKPYEKVTGETDRLVGLWVDAISEMFRKGEGISGKAIRHNLGEIVDSFEGIGIVSEQKVKVGIVGEIYAKYCPLANNNLEDFLAGQGCEVMVPALFGFFLFKVDNRLEDIKLYGGNPVKYAAIHALYRFLEKMEGYLVEALGHSERYLTPSRYQHVKALVKPLIGYGCKMGEGWFLTGEMMELIESGYKNIVCAQPFGCLPNHIVGKGMIRPIREMHPDANIVAVDYDASATRVNQENRIKLMLSVANAALAGGQDNPPAGVLPCEGAAG